MNFLDFLDTAGMLEAKSDGVKAYYFVEGEHEAREYHYSYDDIAAVDPRIVVVLKKMFVEVSHPVVTISSIFAHWLKTTIEHWEHPRCVHTTDGETRYIDDVTSVRFADRTSRVVVLSAQCYMPLKIDDVEYVKHVVPSQITLSFDELEKFYPGWEQRYSFFEALGSPVNDEIRAIFPKKPGTLVQTSDMTGVNFQ